MVPCDFLICLLKFVLLLLEFILSNIIPADSGMGWVNSFLATNCHKDIQKPQDVLGGGEEEVGAPDTEKQNVKSLTLSEMKIAVAKGEFLEVQWTATVAQALLHPELAN